MAEATTTITNNFATMKIEDFKKSNNVFDNDSDTITILLNKDDLIDKLSVISNTSNVVEIVCSYKSVSFRASAQQSSHVMNFYEINNKASFRASFYVKHFLSTLQISEQANKVILELKRNRFVYMTIYSEIDGNVDMTVNQTVVKVYPVDEDKHLCLI